MKKKPENSVKSVLVIGMGAFGYYFAKKMIEAGDQVMVVEDDPDVVDRISEEFHDVQKGDCKNESIIKGLGVKNFDVCVVAVGGDFQSSLMITALLKKYGAKYVVARAGLEIQREILMKIGADDVVYPERETAEKFAMIHHDNDIFNSMPLSSNYSIYETNIPSEWVGKSIISLNIRKKHGINIIAVKNGSFFDPSPSPEYVFNVGDHIIIISEVGKVLKLTRDM